MDGVGRDGDKLAFESWCVSGFTGYVMEGKKEEEKKKKKEKEETAKN